MFVLFLCACVTVCAQLFALFGTEVALRRKKEAIRAAPVNFWVATSFFYPFHVINVYECAGKRIIRFFLFLDVIIYGKSEKILDNCVY